MLPKIVARRRWSRHAAPSMALTGFSQGAAQRHSVPMLTPFHDGSFTDHQCRSRDQKIRPCDMCQLDGCRLKIFVPTSFATTRESLLALGPQSMRDAIELHGMKTL